MSDYNKKYVDVNGELWELVMRPIDIEKILKEEDWRRANEWAEEIALKAYREGYAVGASYLEGEINMNSNSATWKQQSVIRTLVSMGYLASIEAPQTKNEDEPYGNLTIGVASALIRIGKKRKEHGICLRSGQWALWDAKKKVFIAPVTPKIIDYFNLPVIYAESETEIVL